VTATISDTNIPTSLKKQWCVERVEVPTETGGSRFFSTLLASGYDNLQVKESDRHNTSFSAKSGHCRLPFGLCNTPCTFQRTGELVLHGMTWKTVLSYLGGMLMLHKQ
jgi:hypothetical protein